jgi:hypothetical protein
MPHLLVEQPVDLDPRLPDDTLADKGTLWVPNGTGAAGAGGWERIVPAADDKILITDSSQDSGWRLDDAPAGGGGGANAAYSEVVGDGIETAFAINHSLGSLALAVEVWDLSGTDPVLAPNDGTVYDVTVDDADNVTVTFGTAPGSDEARIVMLAAGSPSGFAPVSTVKTDTFSESVATTAQSGDVTGLTVAITPSSTSAVIWIQVELTVSCSAAVDVYATLNRDGSPIYIGDAAGSRARVSSGCSIAANTRLSQLAVSFPADVPATTSEVVYSVRLRHNSGSTQTVWVNRSHADTDNATHMRAASSIMAAEVG